MVDTRMIKPQIRLAGVELYFDNLERARRFYSKTLGLPVTEHDATHHTKLSVGEAFVCLERKGVEHYPSAHKAVVFLEVEDLRAAIKRLDAADILQHDPDAAQPWAAVRDPEGHTVTLLQARSGT
jgi:catechol 2,3-dioxygenase-like lactoylglutathione lyase family enzyme